MSSITMISAGMALLLTAGCTSATMQGNSSKVKSDGGVGTSAKAATSGGRGTPNFGVDNNKNARGGAEPGVDSNQTAQGGDAIGGASNVPPNPDFDASAAARPVVRFGMLVDDANCTLCHVEVHGDVGSIGSVPPVRWDSHAVIFGRWLASGSFDATANLPNPPVDGGILVTGGVAAPYDNAGHELPTDPQGNPTFPTIDFDALAAQVKGSLTSPGPTSTVASITGVLHGNALLVGTMAAPIRLQGDVLVEGDVVITGVYTGVGTIYATGNIYVPANLTAANPASFPYADPTGTDYSAAIAQAKADMQAGKDGLALATERSIFVGDLENYMDATNGATGVTGLHGPQFVSLYDAESIPDSSPGPLLSPRSAIGIEGVYSWLPEASFETLYQSVTPCWTSSSRLLVPGHQWGERAFNRIDAYLYAAKAIGGITRATNWTINGGLIAQTMHIISGSGYDSVQANTPCGASRINFDYRMQNGLPVLGALAPYFPTQSN